MEEVDRGHPGLPEVAMALDGADGLVQRQVILQNLCAELRGAKPIASWICSMDCPFCSKELSSLEANVPCLWLQASGAAPMHPVLIINCMHLDPYQGTCLVCRWMPEQTACTHAAWD